MGKSYDSFHEVKKRKDNLYNDPITYDCAK